MVNSDRNLTFVCTTSSSDVGPICFVFRQYVHFKLFLCTTDDSGVTNVAYGLLCKCF